MKSPKLQKFLWPRISKGLELSLSEMESGIITKLKVTRNSVSFLVMGKGTLGMFSKYIDEECPIFG